MRRMAVTFVVVLVATLTVAGVYAAVSTRADAAKGRSVPSRALPSSRRIASR